MSKKIGEIIANKDYDYIEIRITLPKRDGGGDTFLGVAASKNGELIPLDGDSYSKDEETLHYEEWQNLEKGVKNGLTIVVKGNWFDGSGNPVE